jgi:hypothetical protein
MSFDLFLVTFRNGGKATADAAAARDVLERSRYDHRPEFDAYDISFDDGSHVEMYAGGLHSDDKLFDGAMFALRGLSNAIGIFVFDFSRAGGCVIFPAMKPGCVLLPREDLAAHLPADLGDAFERILVASGDEFLAALTGGCVAWQTYRGHVLRASDGDLASGT